MNWQKYVQQSQDSGNGYSVYYSPSDPSSNQQDNTGGSSSSSASLLGGFTQLGDTIQSNAIGVLKDAQEAARYAEEQRRKDRAEAEDRRRWEAENKRANRAQNLGALDFLGQQRQQAAQNARTAVQIFHDGLTVR
jgi:hypothetical protein